MPEYDCAISNFSQICWQIWPNSSDVQQNYGFCNMSDEWQLYADYVSMLYPYVKILIIIRKCQASFQMPPLKKKKYFKGGYFRISGPYVTLFRTCRLMQFKGFQMVRLREKYTRAQRVPLGTLWKIEPEQSRGTTMPLFMPPSPNSNRGLHFTGSPTSPEISFLAHTLPKQTHCDVCYWMFGGI